MSVYLDKKREQYRSLQTTMEGLTTRAADEDRDLTDEELRSLNEQKELSAKVYGEIETLADIETRSRKVAELGAQVGQVSDTDEHRSSRFTTQDRDPGHYRSVREGGELSFFGDIYTARINHDEDASRRLAEHNRALSTGVAGAGVVAPKWLTDEMETLARQGRALADAVRNIDLGSDPRPITLPKTTGGTDDVIAEQASENTHPAETDSFATDVDTVIPKPTSGIQVVSRQMLEMGTPAVDQLIYSDMIAAYNTKIETKVGTKLLTASGSSVTTLAVEADFDVDSAQDAVVDTAIALWNARKLPGDLLVMNTVRWGKFKKLRDTTNRPLIVGTGGTYNVPGVGDVRAAGDIEGLAVIVSDAVGTGYADDVLVVRAADTILWESTVKRFKFEEVSGPESIKLGIWAYSAVHVRYSGSSSKKFTITAAA